MREWAFTPSVTEGRPWALRGRGQWDPSPPGARAPPGSALPEPLLPGGSRAGGPRSQSSSSLRSQLRKGAPSERGAHPQTRQHLIFANRPPDKHQEEQACEGGAGGSHAAVCPLQANLTLAGRGSGSTQREPRPSAAPAAVVSAGQTGRTVRRARGGRGAEAACAAVPQGGAACCRCPPLSSTPRAATDPEVSLGVCPSPSLCPPVSASPSGPSARRGPGGTPRASVPQSWHLGDSGEQGRWRAKQRPEWREPTGPQPLCPPCSGPTRDAWAWAQADPSEDPPWGQGDFLQTPPLTCLPGKSLRGAPSWPPASA